MSNESQYPNIAEITGDSLIAVNDPRMPSGSFKGELRTAKGEFIAYIYVVNHRVIIAMPREFGHGEIAKRLLGDFDPKQFERAGGCQYSSTQYVKFWQFKA